MAKKKIENGENVTSHVNIEPKQNRDDLLTDLAAQLNKNNKEGGKIAYFLDEQDDPSTITDWISTGNSILDLAISNKPNGGLPVGRMVEFNGLEGTGKSMVAAHICAETQKKGGKAIVIDTENSAAPAFWESLGVNLSSLLYIQRETVEEIFETIENAIAYIRKNTKDALLTIIVDSVAGATTKKEQESEHGVDGYNTGKAIIISKAMRKITGMIGRQRVLIVYTNQLRMNLAAMAFGDKYVVSGGKALAFHCSVRVRLSKTGKLKKNDVIIGDSLKAVVVKNRLGPPWRQAEFDIYYDSGIADYASWIEVLKKNNIVEKNGPGYIYKKDDGEELKFSTNDFVKLMSENPELKAEIYKKICDAVIMIYKSPNSHIVEDVVVDNSPDEDSEKAED
jgi:recombination protein RecA